MYSLNKLRDILRAGDHQKVLRKLEEWEKAGIVSPEILVWKAACIQLGDGSEYSLSEIEEILNSSLQIDSEHIEAILALGWFHLNIQDDVQKALPLFTRAIDIAKSQLTEAIIGTANCLCEVSSVEEALKYLNDVGEGLLNEEEIRGAQNDIEQMIRDV